MKSRFNFILSIKNKNSKETTFGDATETEQLILLIQSSLNRINMSIFIPEFYTFLILVLYL